MPKDIIMDEDDLTHAELGETEILPEDVWTVIKSSTKETQRVLQEQ